MPFVVICIQFHAASLQPPSIHVFFQFHKDQASRICLFTESANAFSSNRCGNLLPYACLNALAYWLVSFWFLLNIFNNFVSDGNLNICSSTPNLFHLGWSNLRVLDVNFFLLAFVSALGCRLSSSCFLKFVLDF
jgi:hypothetical protein